MRLAALLGAALLPALMGRDAAGAEEASQEKKMLNLIHRSRTETTKGSGVCQVAETRTQWDPKQTAAVICDMWDTHWCKGATSRVAEMAPRMNELVTELRNRGVLIVHAPSDTLKSYADHPGRKLAQSAPKVATKAPLQGWVGLTPAREAPLPIDDSDGGCGCEPKCAQGRPWRKQIETIQIKDGDAITDSAEAFYLMKQRGITNVIVMGVHLNMCVLGRPFSIRQMVLQGQNVVLVRDLTDTMYNPRMRPQVDHFTGTDLVVEHIEKYWCPSMTSDQIIGGKPFRFAGDMRPLGADGNPKPPPSKTEAEPDYKHASPEAMERWLDLKYGFRIHWGLYAIKPVGPESWPLSKAGDASWTLTKNGMDFMEWYHRQYRTWNPTGFNADEWIGFMQRGRMKFFVFTTKHHEGFCMFDTKTRVKKRFVYSGPNAGTTEDCDLAYSIMETPFKRDVVKELLEAARKGGIVPGLYFSHPDWYDADFRIDQWNPMKRFVKSIQYTRADDPEAWDRMVKRHREQIREILTNYGPISEASLDMSMPDSFWPDMVETIKLARRLQPDCLFRNRGIGPYGDYHTPEGWIPDPPKSRESTTPWQVIYPLARWFSYDPDDKSYKHGSWIVSNVVDITAKGGLFMVGFGPDGNGKFHPKAAEAVEYAGDWLAVNGEAIFATRPWTYWKEGDDIRFTRTKDNKYVYAIALKWPGGTLAIKSLYAKEGSAVTLLGFREPLTWRNEEQLGLVIELPKELQKEARRPCRQAYAFRVEGVARESTAAPRLVPVGKPMEKDEMIEAQAVTEGSEVRYTTDGGEPGPEAKLYAGPVIVPRGATMKARAFKKGAMPSEVVSIVSGVWRINFQPKGSRLLAGYLADTGEVFGDRGGGMRYGWSADHNSLTRQRKDGLVQDTFCHFLKGQHWKIVWPNGRWNVTVIMGDVSFESVNTINVAGVNFCKDLALEQKTQAITKTVDVTGGELVIDCGDAPDRKTKIVAVEIAPK